MPVLKARTVVAVISVFIAIFGSFSARSSSASSPVVDLGYVRYTGIYKPADRVNAFYGIKYAKSPAGELRWRAPVPIDLDNNGPPLNLTATRPASRCPNGRMPAEFDSLPQSASALDEDCLALDVIVPSVPASSKLPVLVQIHGGGYAIGKSGMFPGDVLVEHSRGNIVYVAIQYRLGLHGFLGGDAIKSDGTWNAGLLDQREALEWIQRHINKFGGDPTKVTIVGGSAGGGSVSLQMILHGGEKSPPYRGVIAEFPWWTPPYGRKGLNQQFNRLLEASGCTDLVCLRQLPIKELVKAGDKSHVDARHAQELASGLFYWGPTIDGVIIQDFPLKEFENGHFSKVPLLTNRNKFEGIMFTNFSLKTTGDVLDDLATTWPNKPTEKLMELYPSSIYNGAMLQDIPFMSLIKLIKRVNTLVEIMTGKTILADAVVQRQSFFGDVLINCPSNYMAKGVSAAGLNAYKMIFNAGIQIHGAIAVYAYGQKTSASGYPDPRRLGELFLNKPLTTTIRDYLVSFTMHLDPNVYARDQANPVWPKFTPEQEATLIVADDRRIHVAKDTDSNERCEALKVLAQ